MSRDRTHALQRYAGLGLAALVVLLVVDSVVLATAAVPSRMLAWLMQGHIVLGVAVAVLLPSFAAAHFVLHRRHRNAAARNAGLVVLAVAIVGCVAGLTLWGLGNARGNRWLVVLHEGAFVAAVICYLLHRRRAKVTVALRPERAAAFVIALLVAGTWLVQIAWPPVETTSTVAATPLDLGLSQARVVDGHTLSPTDLSNSQYCAGCHPSIAKRWQSSVHRFASLNDPFYASTLAHAQQTRTPEQLKFCGGCHDPLLLLTGRMNTHPKPDDPGADEGITCLACHAIVQTPGRLGNASYVIAAPTHYPDHDAEDAGDRDRSAQLLRSKPEQHIASFGPDHLRSPEMCMPCHKAHIPPELNGHRWLAGQNEYDAWHDSAAGGYSARTFFPPKEQKRCQDCHMPKIEADDPAARDGKVADHAFPGANTALPHALGDDEWLARNQAFLEGVVTVDVGAVEFGHDAAVVRQLAPAAEIAVPAGAPLTVDLVVRNRKSGHLFPGGIADLRETWLEVSLVDDGGGTALASGWIDARGHVDPEAHRWNVVLLDGEGKPLRVHDVEDAHVVLTARRILLGASDVVRVALPAPTTSAKLEVRVLHRKFARDYVEFVLGADAAPLPVTVLATTQIQLRPTTDPLLTATPPASDAGPRVRDLGIAHLLRGDTAFARAAATVAAELLPQDPGPRLDLARGALDDGDLERAAGHIREADALAPGHPTAAWLLARVRAAEGNHQAAVTAVDVALEKFPRDRELLVLRADSLFRLGNDDDAANVLEHVLTIDPEHVSAHALLTRIRAEQGDDEAAARHRAMWDRVRPHSEDRALTERARRSEPALDRRANEQYVLPLSPPPTGWTRATP